jgi:pantoate--beta-alanine ligase
MYVRAVHSVKEVREALESEKQIHLVPTMGALHAGHEALMQAARKEAGVVAVSIFVNPLQFGPTEDLARYPRPLAEDLEICERNGVDLVFAPTAQEMYPSPQRTYVEVTSFTDHLCGKFRPGHFRGVATVVLKLFNIFRPHHAYFGEKDIQQLVVIRRMVTDLNLPMTIVGVPIVRESDGLALSSRNKYLKPEQRKAAPALYRALQEAVRLIRSGELDVSGIRETATGILKESPLIRIEYFEIVDPEQLQPLNTIGTSVRVAAAVWIGTTRLIDNVFTGS